MIYLLYGADTYRSRKKLRDIIGEYRKKAGSLLSMRRLDAEEHDPALLGGMITGASLFGGKTLVVIERALSSASASIHLERALKDARGRDGVILVLWEPDLDKEAGERFSSIRKLFDKTEEFSFLKGAALARWIREEGARRGVVLKTSDVERLALLGSDLWAITAEIEKIALGGGRAGVSSPARGNASVFDLGDAFFSRPRDALRHWISLIDAGEHEMRLLSYLAGHIRNMLVVKASVELGRSAPAGYHVHPYALKKAGEIAQRIPLADLVRLPRIFFEADFKIKTGRLKPDDLLITLFSAPRLARQTS